MQANELRIGNWVDWKNPNTKQIERIQIDCDDLRLIIQNNKENDYYPIVLTPDMLINSSLKIDMPESYYELSHSIYLSESGNSVFYLYWEGSSGRGTLKEREILNINFVHQLQNIHFALTGKELDIKP